MVGKAILAIMLIAGPYDSAPNCKVMYQGSQDDWRCKSGHSIWKGLTGGLVCYWAECRVLNRERLSCLALG